MSRYTNSIDEHNLLQWAHVIIRLPFVDMLALWLLTSYASA